MDNNDEEKKEIEMQENAVNNDLQNSTENNNEQNNMENNIEQDNTIKNKKEEKIIKIRLKTLIIAVTIFVMLIVGLILLFFLKYNECSNKRSQIYDLIDAKPIIYFYPENETELFVKLGKPENITCSYPEYEQGWNIKAYPDGTLIDINTGRKLYSLYWEGIHSEPINFNEGFVVKGEEVASFLEEKLSILGLNQFEAEEFIIYWLPKLQENKYNFIRFAPIEEINKNMPLELSSKPDSIIRVLMQYKTIDNYIDVEEQKLETPERTGFVVVEWGGTEIN